VVRGVAGSVGSPVVGVSADCVSRLNRSHPVAVGSENAL
jgi:hypothetical protein